DSYPCSPRLCGESLSSVAPFASFAVNRFCLSDHARLRRSRAITAIILRSSAQSPSSRPPSCLSADRAKCSLPSQFPYATPAGTPVQTAENGLTAILYGWHVQQPASADQPPPACNRTRGYPVPRTPPSLLKSSAAAHA